MVQHPVVLISALTILMNLDHLNRDLGDLLQSANGCPYTDLSEGTLDTVPFKESFALNVLYLNVHSLHKNAVNLTYLLSELEEQGIVVHVIGLCETHLSAISTSSAVIENYQTIHKHRENRPGGGGIITGT